MDFFVKKSDWLWLCPICNVYFDKTNGDKEKHIKEEIREIRITLSVLNMELSNDTNNTSKQNK